MNLTYKVTSDGYEIYRDGQIWMRQGKASNGFFPNRVSNADGTVNYEESAKAHIADIEKAQKDSEDAAVAEQTQLDTIEANTSYLVMISEEA